MSGRGGGSGSGGGSSGGGGASTSTLGAINEAVAAFRRRYAAERTPVLAVVDSLLVLAVVVSVIQLGYCAMVGTFPFNSFLSGFAASLGVFVLTGAAPAHSTAAAAVPHV